MPEEKLRSEGRCIYCNLLVAQSEIGKHLSSHLKEFEKKQRDSTPKVFHLKAEANEWFLHLLVKQNTAMSAVDLFLKNIWLECCGHLSEFSRQRQKISMNLKIEKVFSPKLKFEHHYDFGDTTAIELTCLNSYSIAQKENILLLSRNEPLKILCAMCKKKPATLICAYCIGHEDALYCNACAKEHKNSCDDFNEEEALPIVNSPRMGVCGYTGGSIDLKRDGVYNSAKA